MGAHQRRQTQKALQYCLQHPVHFWPPQNNAQLIRKMALQGTPDKIQFRMRGHCNAVFRNQEVQKMDVVQERADSESSSELSVGVRRAILFAKQLQGISLGLSLGNPNSSSCCTMSKVQRFPLGKYHLFILCGLLLLATSHSNSLFSTWQLRLEKCFPQTVIGQPHTNCNKSKLLDYMP